MLGRAVAEDLSARGYLTLTPPKDELDLLDVESTRSWLVTHQPDAIVHLAGYVRGILGNLRAQVDSFSLNARMSLNLFEACSETPPSRLVVSGTVAAYGYPYRSIPLTESDFLAGDVHGGEYGYGWAKRMMYGAAQILRRESGVDTTVALLTNLFGPGDRFMGETTHVVPALIRRFADASDEGAPTVDVWGSPSTTRDFMYSHDAAGALGALTVTPHDLPPVVNVASGHERTMGDVVTTIAEAAQFTGVVNWDQTMPVGIAHRSVDVTLLEQFDLRRPIGFENGVRTTMAWYRRNRDTCR
jgi:GDP-L-fucose synthase